MVSYSRVVLALLVGSLWLSPHLSHATTYYVAPSGQGGCSTNTNSPQGGLNNGIGCLNSGDTLLAKNGTYVEKVNANSIPNGSSSSPTVVRAENQRGAIIRPSNVQDFVADFSNDKHWITFDGFVIDMVDMNPPAIGIRVHAQTGTSDLLIQNHEIRNAKGANSAAQSDGLTADWPTSNVVFRGIYVHDIGYDQAPGCCCNACYSYGIYMSGAGYVVENSTFVNISGHGIHGYSSGIGSASNNIVRNNYLENVGFVAILACQRDNQIYNNVIKHTGLNGTEYGIVLGRFCPGSLSNNLVANNTVTQTTGACIDLGGSSDGLIQNNICWSNSGGDTIFVSDGTNNTVDTNLCSSGGCSFYADPRFVSTSDFHLLSESQARERGANLNSRFTTDKDGTVRGASWDLGAYEFGGGSQLPAPTNLRLLGITNP